MKKRSYKFIGLSLRSTSKNFKNTNGPPSNSKPLAKEHKESNFSISGASSRSLRTTKILNTLVYFSKVKPQGQAECGNTTKEKPSSKVR